MGHSYAIVSGCLNRACIAIELRIDSRIQSCAKRVGSNQMQGLKLLINTDQKFIIREGMARGMCSMGENVPEDVAVSLGPVVEHYGRVSGGVPLPPALRWSGGGQQRRTGHASIGDKVGETHCCGIAVAGIM